MTSHKKMWTMTYFTAIENGIYRVCIEREREREIDGVVFIRFQQLRWNVNRDKYVR